MARDYDYLFKLLIIGDSGEFHSITNISREIPLLQTKIHGFTERPSKEPKTGRNAIVLSLVFRFVIQHNSLPLWF